jgi:energy-coupling factor transporter ATP-binding protein EcfA2
MARRKAGDHKAAKKNITDAGDEENISRVQAEDNSIAIDEINIGGDVSGTITIAHTIGYTAAQVSDLLEKITSRLQPKKFDGRSPYKGLEVFEEEDAELFFGRERLIDDLVSRVKESRTVFITGPSGSGKSSLVRAGLIHTLKQGGISALRSEGWLYETMKPGREPLKDLALAFSRLKSPELQDYLLAHINETDILNKCAESVLSAHKNQRLILFVDQFEEVFTQISQEEERVAFINMLAHAGTVQDGRVIVLFAMRSDFVSNCATYPALNELLSQQFRQIGAMQPEELVSAIALPARRVGLPIEDELIARIINDMKGEPGALPLMQFALKDLFDSQQEQGGVVALTLKDYLKHGGIHKALERHADRTFAALSEREQELARSIFSGLIQIGRGTQDTKRTALFDELIPANAKAEDVSAIVQRLADARLVITDEQANKDTVTLSHEKLIEAWPWLKKLVNENREVIALQNEIANDAKEWADHERDMSYLYTGARLGIAQEQVLAGRIRLSGLANEFIDQGIKAREAESKAKETLRRRITTGLITGTAIALVLAGFAVYQMVQAQKQANIALARQLAAQAQSIYRTESSNQEIAVLLAVRSMQVFPVSDAAQLLQNNTSRLTSHMTYDRLVNSAAFSPDGQYVVWGSYDGTARVLEATTGNEIARITHDDGSHSVAFSPDGQYIVSRGCDERATDRSCLKGSARVWGATTGNEIARMTHGGQVHSVAFSPDGQYVVSGSGDGTARVWEATTGNEIARITHNDRLNSVAFSPDGQYVVSAGDDSTARVWEATTGNEIAHITHGGPVFSVAFSPDGQYVVSGSYDGTARVWEATTGNEIARMTHDSEVYSVAFSPDGQYVGSGSVDGTAHVWIYRPEDLIAHTCSHLNRNLTRAEWDKYIGNILPYEAICPNLPIEPEATP